MKIEQFYEQCGGNLSEVKSRIPSNPLLLKLIRMFINDPSKDALDKAVAEMNQEEAFRAVHTLKGVCLSLGLESLSVPSKELCEILRPGTFGEGWEEQYKKVCAEYTKIIEAINLLED